MTGPILGTMTTMPRMPRCQVGVFPQIWERCESTVDQKPDWDSESGDMTLTEEKMESEYDMWNVRYVLEEPLWVISARIPGARRCPVCAHDSRKVEHCRLCGAFAELYFFMREI